MLQQKITYTYLVIYYTVDMKKKKDLVKCECCLCNENKGSFGNLESIKVCRGTTSILGGV